jgi:hypothetical protein
MLAFCAEGTIAAARDTKMSSRKSYPPLAAPHVMALNQLPQKALADPDQV